MVTKYTVKTEDVEACIRENGLYGFSTSDLRILMREDSLKSDPAAQIRHAAARHVLVS